MTGTNRIAMMKTSETVLIAIDPGPEQSGWVRFTEANHYDNDKPEPLICRVMCNLECLVRLEARGVLVRGDLPMTNLVVEMTASMGMAVGESVFETTYWVGRLCEAPKMPFERIKRHEVKMYLCNSTRAKDANIRQRLIDLWGGKEKAIGRKKTPGPLYGVKADCWQALALAVTWWETCRATVGE